MILGSVLEKLEYHKVLQYVSRYCITEKGRSQLLSITPIDSLAEIKYEGELVNEAKDILIRNIPPPLEYLQDLNETISMGNIEGAVIDGKKILEILKLAVVSRNLAHHLKQNAQTAPVLFELNPRLFADKLFEHYIQKIINENGEVRDNASAKLAEIRKEIRDKRDDLVKSVNRLIKSLTDKDIVREEYLTLRDGRIVIPVKAEHKRHIRGFIHSESSTGQTVYIEPEETLELNNDIVSLSFAEKREIERLLKEITKRIGDVSGELKESMNAVAYIDTIFARANYSLEVVGSFPEINNEKPFSVNDARHPILLKKFGKSGTVPLNFSIENKKVVLITGPNAGGKTVVLKTIGLLTLMVQSGIHIPAGPDSNFNFFSKVLLDVGDSQSIEDDLSTFSSHLSNIKNILEEADDSSLILLDEIGTGTDPSEGSALASAVLIMLKDKNSIVFATTHHGSLKLIANDLEGFENAAMEFDTQNLKPTYVFKQGIPGSSYAFEVAKRIGLPDDFLFLASKHLDTDKHKIENFLVDIEQKSQELEAKLKSMEIENTRLKGLSNLYSQKIEKLDKEKKEILKRTKSEAEDYLKGINKKIELVIKELKESNAEREVIKKARSIISEVKQENKNLFSDNVDLYRENPNFDIGNFVGIKNTETVGEIIDILKEKNKATIKIGSVKMQVALNDLIHAKQQKEKPVNLNYNHFTLAPADYRIDIRGKKPEEVEFEILKFIDSAYSTGLERVEILHGKGTGALKKTVHDILKRHDKVKNYYFAPIEFGGEGITIAELN